jgi:hypothetical protein
MALPDDLSPDRNPRGKRPCRNCIHGYHLLVLSHGLLEPSGRHCHPATGLCGGPGLDAPSRFAVDRRGSHNITYRLWNR